MDPRPYNYEYRRPRPTNRTYQSYNAYESLYHMGKVDPKPYSTNFLRQQYSSKLDLYSPKYTNPYSNNIVQQNRYDAPVQPATKHYENTAVNTDKNSNRAGSNLSERSRSSSVSVNSNNIAVRPSVLSTYGSNSLEKNWQRNQQQERRQNDRTGIYIKGNESSKVFEKQQRPFDIINLYSRASQPLRMYPKLTMEHLILEKGMDIAS